MLKESSVLGMVLESQIVDQLLPLSLTYDKKNIWSVVFGILFLKN